MEESVEAAFLRESINRFLDGCTEIQRDVFLRRYWYFDTISKISRRYGFTQSKVKMMLLRMREELRKHLQREGYQI